MKKLMLASLTLLAGCSISVDPGIPETYTTRTSWKGTRLRVEALPAGPAVGSAPGANTYEFDPAEWNPFLAKNLGEDLVELGSVESDGAVMKIGILKVTLEERAAAQGSRAQVWIRVESPAGSKEYSGVNESQLNYKDSARRAAAQALKALVEDEELRRGFTVNPK